jgi:hypothetical protein
MGHPDLGEYPWGFDPRCQKAVAKKKLPYSFFSLKSSTSEATINAARITIPQNPACVYFAIMSSNNPRIINMTILRQAVPFLLIGKMTI